MPGVNSIWVFFGLIATGKSTLAAAWAARHNMAHYNSDLLRKELAGLAPTAGQQESLDKGIYSSDFSRLTYDALLTRAEQEVRAARSVVLDASYQSRVERDRLRDLAARLGADVFFIHCICPEDEIMRRLEIRSHDPEAVSDGRPAIYQAQKERFELAEELDDTQLVTLTTVGDINDLLAELDKIFEVKEHV